MPDNSSNPGSRGSPLIAAGLLLAALALVVLYTGQRAFLSPVALVVVAAIGVAALLLQLWLRPDLSASNSGRAGRIRASLLLNVAGVIFAVGAIFADVVHLTETLMLIAALGAVVSFGFSGVILLSALRKRGA